MKVTHKFACIVGFMLLVIAVSMPASISAQDDDVFLDIIMLEDGDTISGVFEGNVTGRLYGFSASQGDRVTINMTQSSEGLNPWIVLLGSRGEVLTDDDDSGELEFSASISNYLMPADSSYFLLVSDYNYRDNILVEAGEVAPLEAPLEYTLSISGIRPATGDPQFVEIYRGWLEMGDEARGGSSPREPVFYYGFLGTQDQVVDITMQSEEFDSGLHLFAPGGDRIAVNDDQNPGVGEPDAALVNVTLPEDGLYIIFATDLFFYNAGKNLQNQSFVGGRFILNLDVSAQ